MDQHSCSNLISEYESGNIPNHSLAHDFLKRMSFFHIRTYSFKLLECGIQDKIKRNFSQIDHAVVNQNELIGNIFIEKK